jgi:hypothetical protein
MTAGFHVKREPRRFVRLGTATCWADPGAARGQDLAGVARFHVKRDLKQDLNDALEWVERVNQVFNGQNRLRCARA